MAMKKTLVLIVVPLLVILALGYLFREPLKVPVFAWLTRDMFVPADDDDFNPGPVVGSRFPGLQASYQGRTVTLLEEFAGSNGTVFIASRSLDWCPFCMRQMIQLQETRPGFDAAGIGMVAMTYDEPALQRAFIDRHGITIPVLSDNDALSFKTLGILDTGYSPGDPRYGIPYPGMIIVDTQGVVVGKLFVEDYTSRVDSAAALAVAKNALALD
jgi:peroxiredoxin